MPDAAEPSIVVDLWTVSDGSQDEFLAALQAMFERLRELEGFVEGTILEGVDRTRFVSFARMRTSADREAAFLDVQIEMLMRSIGGIARPSPHAYSVFRSFTSTGSTGG